LEVEWTAFACNRIPGGINLRRAAATALVLITILTATARSLPTGEPPLEPRPGTGMFLLLSDIHFDPYADTAILEQLGAKPLDACKGRISTAPSKFGSDTNYPLLKSTLDNVAATAAANHIHYDYAVVTGDLLAHQFDATFNQCVGGGQGAYEKFASATIAYVDALIAKAIPGVPVFITLGNNDSDKGDYAEPSPAFLQSVGQDWSRAWGNIPAAVRQSAVASFERAGNYAVPNPAVPGEELVVLNSNLWVARNSGACGPADPDPDGQFSWLENVLIRVKNERRFATLIMHVLPGMDALRSSAGEPQSLWTSLCTQRFIGEMSNFRDVVHEIYAGHIHRDDFRILPDRDGKPLLPIHILPSVSPVYFNNPAVEIGWYDKRTGELVDFSPFFLDLANGRTNWAREYTFSQAYGFPRPTLTALVDLSREIRDGNPQSGVGEKYSTYYSVGVGLFLTSANWMNYTCTQTEFAPRMFTRCKSEDPHH
jgi:sphingomyelin phosphodiesterase acid-like 3